MKIIIGFVLCLSFQITVAQIHIIPWPSSVKQQPGFFQYDADVKFVYNNDSILTLIKYFEQQVNSRYTLSKPAGNKKIISLQLTNTTRTTLQNECYQLNVQKNNISISAANISGIFYGLQTLLQLLFNDENNNVKIPCVQILDTPRFTYRGMHLDVARHFFTVKEVKRYIDLMAYQKFNYFHWHLTDDQGWRIEIKKYPLLTSIGSCREQTLIGRFGSDKYDGKRYCGYYTQEEIKEVVKYAGERCITVIPEIDVPGHTMAALASYPFLGCTKGNYKVRETWGVQPDVLCAGNDSTYQFLEDVFDELTSLFPSKYFHIGGDECPKEKWKTCKVCQRRIKELKLKNEQELQSYLIQRIEKYINSKGKTIIGWDEILEGGLAPNAIVMSWRGTKGGISAAQKKHEVIMTPEDPYYLNLSESKNEDSVTQGGYNPIENVYNFNPVPEVLTNKEKGYIKGIQGNIWTEYISCVDKLDYMLFPRMSALAESAWSTDKKWDRFELSLPQLFKKIISWGAGYNNAYYNIQPTLLNLNDSIAWKLERKGNDTIYYTNDNWKQAMRYLQPLVINKSGTWKAAFKNEKGDWLKNSLSQEFQLHKAAGKKVTLSYEPNSKYKGYGGFTLVDGIQNKTGMLKSSEFLGFIPSNFEALIDLGALTIVDSVVVHVFEQKQSWIYKPKNIIVSVSKDGIFFTPLLLFSSTGLKNIRYTFNNDGLTRYIKVFGETNGIIPTGEPGAGHQSWLFVDEIEVK